MYTLTWQEGWMEYTLRFFSKDKLEKAISRLQAEGIEKCYVESPSGDLTVYEGDSTETFPGESPEDRAERLWWQERILS